MAGALFPIRGAKKFKTKLHFRPALPIRRHAGSCSASVIDFGVRVEIFETRLPAK
jgi:hypothetical protein